MNSPLSYELPQVNCLSVKEIIKLKTTDNRSLEKAFIIFKIGVGIVRRCRKRFINTFPCTIVAVGFDGRFYHFLEIMQVIHIRVARSRNMATYIYFGFL